VVETFSALAEPNRLRIVELLHTSSDASMSVGAIGERLRLRQPQVSKHLRVLKEAGLVDVEVRAQQRLYELRPERLRQLHEWLERFRDVWDARLDRLDDYLQDMKGERSSASARWVERKKPSDR
jgi:DNA-binding transcriptional ArsR family regulator